MPSYAVLWALKGVDKKPLAGRLQVSEQGVVLHGGSRSAERRIEIPGREIRCARRAITNVGPLPAIALEAASAGTILIATISGLSCRSEILEQLQRLAA
jgi:hypothetical protein